MSLLISSTDIFTLEHLLSFRLITSFCVVRQGTLYKRFSFNFVALSSSNHDICYIFHVPSISLIITLEFCFLLSRRVCVRLYIHTVVTSTVLISRRMGVDIRHNKDRKVHRTEPKSQDIYLRLLVKLYRFVEVFSLSFNPRCSTYKKSLTGYLTHWFDFCFYVIYF